MSLHEYAVSMVAGIVLAGIGVGLVFGAGPALGCAGVLVIITTALGAVVAR